MPTTETLKTMATRKRADISDRRRHTIAELAEAVAADVVSGTGDGKPVDAALALRNEGVAVVYDDFGDAFDGLLELRSGRFWAYVNLARCGGRPDASRARFTAAHEAGHYFLDEHRHALLDGRPPHGSLTDFASHLRVEHEADLFAAHLLMPTERFMNEARRAGRGLDAVLALRERFGTSIKSTALRYVEVGAAPCAVVRWRPDGSAWQWVSEAFRGRGLRRAVDAAGRVPRGGATYLVMGSPSAAESERPCTSAATAGFWFDGVRPGSSRDVVLIEQALGLGSHGAIFMLTEADS